MSMPVQVFPYVASGLHKIIDVRPHETNIDSTGGSTCAAAGAFRFFMQKNRYWKPCRKSRFHRGARLYGRHVQSACIVCRLMDCGQRICGTGHFKNWFDARWKYIFDIIRLIYLYGPVYSRNCSDYVFALTADSGDSYTFSFESSDRYPRKNPLYAKGQMEIDAASMKLKSIRIDNMGIHYAGKYSRREYMLKKYPDPHDSRILQDCVDCDFEVNGFGEISYALIHVLWSPTNKQYYKGGCGNQPRANVAGTDFVVTECWKSDLLDFESLPDSTIQKLQIRNPCSAFCTDP